MCQWRRWRGSRSEGEKNYSKHLPTQAEDPMALTTPASIYRVFATRISPYSHPNTQSLPHALATTQQSPTTDGGWEIDLSSLPADWIFIKRKKLVDDVTDAIVVVSPRGGVGVPHGEWVISLILLQLNLGEGKRSMRDAPTKIEGREEAT